METQQDRIIKQKLDKIFGDSAAAQEMKQFLFLTQTGRMTEEMLQDYHARSIAETNRMINALQPYQSETQDSKTIYGVLASEVPEICEGNINADALTARVEPTEARHQDPILIDARDRVYTA